MFIIIPFLFYLKHDRNPIDAFINLPAKYIS